MFDTLAVMYRRMWQGKSPFKPDRGHIHHILIGAGLGPRATLLALIVLAAAMASMIGVTRSLGANSTSSLMTFCLLLMVYIVTVTRIWVRQEAKRAPIIRPLAANDADMTPRSLQSVQAHTGEALAK
jgi:UDP-GlcNAc:undecaprenyl-phosphate GlcNAc-1-phosphate transferase